MLKTLSAVAAFAIVGLVVVAAGLMPARAQGLPGKPAGVAAVDGDQSGQVAVSWQGVEGAALYRIGWVAYDEITAVRNAGQPWVDAFAFKDVTNYGQTTHRLAGLLPGVRYAFIVGSLNSRFGAAAWSEWAYLTTAEGRVQCPARPGEPPAPLTPGPSATPDPNARPVPSATPGLTATPDPNVTPGPSATPDPDATPVPSATPDTDATPAPGSTRIPTPTSGATATPTPTLAPTPVATPAATPLPTPTLAPTATPTPTPRPAAGGIDYDKDDDGLIEISSLAQLDAVRYDLDGDGVVSADADGYGAAFPNAAAGMGCFRNRCGGYELAANLDFDTDGSGEADAGDAYWDDGDGWDRIGDIVAPFNTVLEGNGLTIANLYIDRTDTSDIGLLGAIGEDGVIRNVRLTGVRVAGKDWVGGLVGNNGGIISGSSAAGRASGERGIGGLAGSNGGSISGSSAAVAVAGSDIYVGGLVGFFSSGAISGSHATGKATGVSMVGGLVGSSWGAISGSYATGSATAGSDSGGSDSGDGIAGGLVGHMERGAITSSYATGSAAGDDAVGGLVGFSSRGAITASYATGSATGTREVGGLLGGGGIGSITASYATGNATGDRDVGGLVGSGSIGSIVASYAIGKVTGTRDAGGLVGRGVISRSETAAGSYWDAQTTGQSSSAEGTGKTTRELQQPTGAAGIYAGWDAEYWDFGTSRQYPALKYDGMDVEAQRR